jgi:hypothetical protein
VFPLVRNICAVAVVAALLAGATAGAQALIDGGDVRNDSLTGKDIRNKSLTKKDFRGSVRGPRGFRGPQGADGARGQQGLQGPQGQTGPSGPFPDPLESGTTLRGFWGHTWHAAAAAEFDNLFYSYGGFRLSAAPTKHYIPAAAAAPAGCTGGTFDNPAADPGHLCVYEHSRSNTSGVPAVCSINACNTTDDNGFQIALSSAAAGQVVARGSWAVTAP